jgi:hypothetical protein
MPNIKSRGFWRVTLRPTLFQADRIPSLSDCEKLVADCKVSLRGWDYPHYDTVVSGRDYIWSDTNRGSKKEVWRFYQSGQFANYFACPEDWWKEDPITSWEAKQYTSGQALEVLMALFRLTEIYEFAARLAQKGVFGDELILTVSLHGMLERRLITLHAMLELDLYEPVCKMPDLLLEKGLPVKELVATASELSLDHALWIFERFNWRDVKKSTGALDVLRSEQKKLLERRL